MAERQQKTVDFFVDQRYTTEQRENIGKEIIKYIKERTSKGNGIDNQPFQQTSKYLGNRTNQRTYSDSYRNSNEFEIAGKGASPINLRLTGDMLDSLEVLDISLRGRIRVGFESSGDESDKAWFNEEKGYRFLDLSQEELEKLTRIGAGSVRTQANAVSQSFAESIARRLFGRS